MTNPSSPTEGTDQPQSRRSDLWSLDEYIVVGDLNLRRGRSSGVGDPEVIALAELTGRTPASISRRLGNFDGTARPGMGLKPVLGEALEVFLRMEADPAVRERLTQEARTRLGANGASTTVAAGPRIVDPEDFQAEIVDVTTPAVTRELHRLEAQLVRRYRAWRDPSGTRLRGLVIPTPDATLRADLFDIGIADLLAAGRVDPVARRRGRVA